MPSFIHDALGPQQKKAKTLTVANCPHCDTGTYALASHPLHTSRCNIYVIMYVYVYIIICMCMLYTV